jgi:2-dehydropantoate 2-reductase
MRIIIYGLGAVGGVVAAALHHAGQEVVAIARGAQLTTVRDTGLRLRAALQDLRAQVPCVSHPAELSLRPDDAVLMTMKSQDSWAALQDLRGAGAEAQPVFCLQNGVANERMALRLFPNVHGVTVMLPAQYLTPGQVATSVGPKFGMFDLGCATGGHDAADAALAQRLEQANFATFLHVDIMASKFGKLRMNLGNVLQAALGRNIRAPQAMQALEAEFDAVTKAAGQAWEDVAQDARRMQHIQPADVAGVTRVGGSSTQSLIRGTGTIETDYLNGEVAMMGAQHGVPTPCNRNATRLGAYLVTAGQKPGDLSPDQVTDAILTGRLPGQHNSS